MSNPRWVLPLALVIGKRPDVDAARVTASDVEDLFFAGGGEDGIGIGDGLLEAECTPANPSGLGSPWSCKLETDSSGDITLRVRISEGGRFRAESGRYGCCVPVARP